MGPETEKGSKEMSRIIVCDTGPLLHLNEAGAIHLLPLAGEILVPPAVGVEFKRNARERIPAWVKIRRLRQHEQQQAAKWVENAMIDPGEAEAISLALQTGCDWLLTDDAQARQLAETLDLDVHGSVGVLLWAAAVGHIKSRGEARKLLDALGRSTLWISDRVIEEAARAIEELLPE